MEKLKKILRWTERYTKTDMIYAAKGSFWTFVGKGTLLLISIATLTAFANLLPIETYGAYQFVLSVAGIAAITALSGMGPALGRSIAKGYEGALSLAFKTKVKWSLIGSAGLLAVSSWYLFNNNLSLAAAFFTVALLFPIASIANIFVSFWQGRKRFDVQSLYSILSTLPAATIIIITLFLTDNLVLIVLAFYTSYATFRGIAYLRALKKIKNNKRDKDMVSFGKHLTVMNVIDAVSSHIDKVILWKFLGPAQVAIYALAIMPIQQISSFNPIHNIALPKLSEHGVRGKERKRDIFRKFLILFAITVPTAIILVLIAPFVYKLLFPQYLDSVKYFQALCAWLALLPFTLLSASLVAEMKTRFLYGEQVTVPLIKIGLFFTLAYFYGIWGMVLAIIIAEILRGGLLLYFFKKM